MKNKAWIWIGVGTALVVGVGIFFLTRGKKKSSFQDWQNAGSPGTFEQWKKLTDTEKEQLIASANELQAEPTAKGIRVGNSVIDLSKFKIDMNEVARILTTPVDKKRKYELLEQAGVQTQTLDLVKKADDAQQRKNVSDTLKRLRKQESSNVLIGIK